MCRWTAASAFLSRATTTMRNAGMSSQSVELSVRLQQCSSTDVEPWSIGYLIVSDIRGVVMTK